MDLLSFAVVSIILVASGGIAWVADGLGKKIGKKRISIRFRGWSMRPKHVASLGTVLMGVTVSFLTIAFVAAVSRDAREWLKQGRGLLVQRDALQESVDVQKAQLGGLNDQIRDNRSQIREEQVELDRRQRKLDERQRRIASLDKELQDKDRTLQTTNASLRSVQADLADRQARLRSQQRQLLALQRRVVDSLGQVKKANATLVAINGRLVVTKANLNRSLGELKTAKHNATVANSSAKRAYVTSMETYSNLEEEVKTRKDLVDSLKAEAAELIAQRDEAQKQADAAQTRYASILTDLGKANQELADTQSALQSVLNSGFRTSRTERITYNRGEEVARVVVPAESNVEATRNILASLLRTARIVAAERGAKGHRGFEAADIVDRKDPQTGEVADADTLKRALVANLAGRTEDQVLVATSSLNAFEGEPVSLDLVAMPNPVVYHRNDTIAETRIDGAQSEDRILAQLSDFMNGELRQRARKDRMVPRAGTAAPYGEPSAANVWSALQSVRRAGRTVRVQAVAEDDIRAADPLRLGFRVH